MSKVKNRDTSLELAFRVALWHRGVRYRLRAKIKGRPDLVFLRPKIAVFVDGCFWHSCPEHGQRPASNADFWKKKLDANVQRDTLVTDELQKAGWKVLRFWEHELKRDMAACVDLVIATLHERRYDAQKKATERPGGNKN